MTGPRGTPLDLRAIEARLENWPTSGARNDDLRVLLAHCRALAGALEALAYEVGEYMAGDEDQYPELARLQQEAAAVLAQAKDSKE